MGTKGATGGRLVSGIPGADQQVSYMYSWTLPINMVNHAAASASRNIVQKLCKPCRFDQLQTVSLEDSEATVLPESAGRERLRPDTPKAFSHRCVSC